MTKAYEMYKRIDIPQGVSLLPCPCCGMDAQLWRYAESETGTSTPVVMCENGAKFGPQDGIAGEGCLLFMPPDNFYRATVREAVKYWNEYANALMAMQRKNRWKTASVLRNGQRTEAVLNKQQLWKLIEQYRMSGGREEHWRNRDILDHAIDVALDDSLIASQAKRLALELECLLNDTQDTTKVSKWWGSAMEALQLYRDACSVAYSGEQT